MVVKAQRCLRIIEQRAIATIGMTKKSLSKAVKQQPSLRNLNVQKNLQWPPSHNSPASASPHNHYPGYDHHYDHHNHQHNNDDWSGHQTPSRVHVSPAVSRSPPTKQQSKYHLIAHRLPTDLSQWMRDQGCPYESKLHTMSRLSAPPAFDFAQQFALDFVQQS